MVRNPILHGRFYEADPDGLARSVDAFLQATDEPVQLPAALRESLPAEALPESALPTLPVARAVMLPHAGHIYCGRVIGQTLARCRLPHRLILLCPNHTGEGEPLAVWPSGSWVTPLGTVPVDEELCAALINQPGFSADISAHKGEHSLEVLLPFLQRHTPECSIAPVRVACGPDQLQEGAAGLAWVLRHFSEQGQSVGVVISSDMNHYAPQEENMRRDTTALIPLLSNDAASLFNTVHAKDISMCGVAPATMALLALNALAEHSGHALLRPTLTAYATSAEASHDATAVVGYAGVVWI